MTRRSEEQTATNHGRREGLDEWERSLPDSHPAPDLAGAGLLTASPQRAGGAISEMLRRELRVATSRRSQPVWFRVTKWTVFLTISGLAWKTGHFRSWLLGATAAGVSVHLIWRRKTRGWTRPWGGWNDLDAGRR